MTFKFPLIAPSVLAISLGFIWVSAVPATAQNAPSTFEECAGVPDDVERLACYDEVATSKVPDTINAMRQAKIEQQKREFGLFTPGPGQVLDELPVNIVSWRMNKLRKIELTTEDGAIWVQADTKTVYYPKTISGKIKKGMMGAYFFSPDTDDRAIKVERRK